jgi:hypothetical protein
MAKTFFLANRFYRYCALIFRDHESWPAEYLAGYSLRASAGLRAAIS